MIRQFRVCNFKSLGDVTIKFNDITVLVGRSGTGKSNIVKAIRFLRSFLFTPNFAQDSSNFAEVAPRGKDSFTLTFEVNFIVPGIEEEFFYRLVIPVRDKSSQSLEELSFGGKQLFELRGQTWNKAPEGVSQNPRSFPVLGHLPSVSNAVIAFAVLTSGVGCYEFPLGVLTGKTRDQNDLGGLRDTGSNYLDVLRGISNNVRDLNARKAILAALASVNPSVTAVELDSLRSPQNIIISHRFNDAVISLNLSQESEGFRRLLAHLLAIYQDPPKQTLVFEEPENAIYPGALALLAGELKAAPCLSRGQVILTTHSPGLLDHFSVDDLRVVTLNNGWTAVDSITPGQAEAVREGLLTTGELLTTDPARPAHLETLDA